jgi:Transcriptional regulator, AbiEi antitoxin, Type IV TA system/Transcriptional regulator, AbiEi antitoxin N-terminal domain
MATQIRNKLNTLYTQTAAGTPITSASLAALGISSNLAGQYAKAGWLTRLSQGVYARANDVLDLYRCLAVLQNSVDGLHVGGKTALDWHGLRQYVSLKPTLQLYGWETASLPTWFTSRFPAEYRRKRLFREVTRQLLHVQPHAGSDALVSSPERALLEMLSEVGLRQPLQEAREIAGSTHHLRSRVLSQLLEHCTSVKTVRLCLQMGRELQLPWAKKLNIETLPSGSKSPWVSQSRDGLLVLK